MQETYSDWLQTYNWDYFFTATFRSPRREPYYVQKHVWAELQKHEVARAFMGVEPFASGDLHIHGIMSGRGGGFEPEIALPWEIWRGLFDRFGRAKVEACNSRAAVSTYCAKYIMKAQHIVSDHYGVFGNAESWRRGIDSYAILPSNDNKRGLNE